MIRTMKDLLRQGNNGLISGNVNTSSSLNNNSTTGGNSYFSRNDMTNLEREKLPLDQNYIYIYHLPSDNSGTGTYIFLPQWPDTITDKISSNFSATSALARTAPVQSYIQSGPREVQFSITLHRDMMDESNLGFSNAAVKLGDDYVDTIIKQMQAISLPTYNYGNKEVQPPMIAVKFGNDIFVKGIVNGGIGVEYNKPLLYNNKYAIAKISFVVTEIDPMDAVSIAKLGSFRNITKSFQTLVTRAWDNIG